MKQLARFTIEETEEGYLFSIATQDGETLEVEASPEQVDALIFALDDLLGDDEEFEIDGEEDGEAAPA